MRFVSELEHDQPDVAEAEIRSVGIDDYAHVRYIHATAFRLLAAPFVEEHEVAALSARFYAPDYTDDLMREDLCAAWIDGEMVGTAGWLAADDSGAVARITSVYVRPLFTALGIGSRLVMEAEERARRCGFRSFSARATTGSAKFFERLGYEVTSHGALNLVGDRGLPLTYLRKRGDRRGATALRRETGPSLAPAALASVAMPSALSTSTASAPVRVEVAELMAAAAIVPPPALKLIRQ